MKETAGRKGKEEENSSLSLFFLGGGGVRTASLVTLVDKKKRDLTLSALEGHFRREKKRRKSPFWIRLPPSLERLGSFEKAPCGLS